MVIVQLMGAPAPIGVVPLHVAKISQRCCMPCAGCAVASAAPTLFMLRQEIIASGILLQPSVSPDIGVDFFFVVNGEGASVESGDVRRFALCHCEELLPGGAMRMLPAVTLCWRWHGLPFIKRLRISRGKETTIEYVPTTRNFAYSEAAKSTLMP